MAGWVHMIIAPNRHTTEGVVIPLRDGDVAHLVRAIALAQHAAWRTSPNPTVGCVIVRAGTVVGEGVTRPPGGAHAEIVALERAGDRAHGANAYVTLAPCGHHGRTPPCVDALIAAGIDRVVIGIDDPHTVATGGVERLKRAGVTVTLLDGTHPVAAAISGQLADFLTVVTQERPHVTLKVAQTLGGSMQSSSGRWITSSKARRAVHRLRSQVDAVLVGAGTVLADDPQLTVRDLDNHTKGQPRAVVVDRRLRTPPSAAVARPNTLVLTATGHSHDQLASLRATGVTIVELPTAAHSGPLTRTTDANPTIRDAIATLVEFGISSVLAEPGPTLAQAMLDGGVVDRMVVHVADDATETYRCALDSQRLSTTLTRLGGIGPDVIIDHQIHHHYDNRE
ncbi:MAG: bifunctional diaminohydroxyphosphoribosylaminopyrimidine deaminase/5-amino-6-(5-phosphoribosylamino)uracil reductase RibD [Nitriliruptoraceae bacterium]